MNVVLVVFHKQGTKVMRSTSGQAMVWDRMSLCLIIMIVVVNALVSMLVGAVRNDHKHARRELMQNIPGFISIDCGLPVGSPGYIYQETGIDYVPDEGFTETGESNNITSKVDETIEPYLKNVRSFPEGKRNCYSLKPKAGRNNTYLVRATFLYGNYDSRNSPPEFDLHLGTDMWVSVIFSTNYTRLVRKEILYIPTTDYIDVCLVNTNKGVPFISVLELRLLNNDIYRTQSGSALQTLERSDYGANTTQPPIRYKDDVYDRLWFPVKTLPDLMTVETKLTTDVLSNNEYKPPPVVMRTAVRSAKNNGSLVLNWKPPDTTSGYYVYMHFFEVDSTVRIPRQFTIDLNNIPWLKAENLPVNKPLTVFATAALKGVELKLTISPTDVSTFPPLLNAMEIYIEKHLQQLHTQLEDVDAMKSIKTSYKIISNWQGDPCLTEDYLWDGLKCNYDQNTSIIISLNLTRRELTGEVDHSISNLKSLESLDLSYNNLSGEIPAFLADMPSLKVLNLAGNKFTGSVPQALLSKNGSTLTLSVGENPYLCVSLCGTKKSSKKMYIVPVSIISVLVLVVSVGAFIFWKCGRIGSQEMAIEITKVPLVSKTQSFTYSEITSITNNFETPLGKGASGEVYRGYLKDQEVAVKILTKSSTKSAGLFQTEVELLWRIHHNRLVSFLGYCNDGTNMAVVYEFMASGSLKKNLAGENRKILTWKERLQIAVDAAQGLEYLHKHCTPSIVHRDLKPDNILLDKNLRAKISDFGISIFFEAENKTHMTMENIAGTRGYLDPEYHSTGKLSEKSDVYSFGIVLLELITGQPSEIKETEGSQQFIHRVKWIEPLLKERDINAIIDSRLQGNFGMDSALKLIEIAMECVLETAKQRPCMATVLAKLKECLTLESRDVGASRVDADDKGTSRLIKRAPTEM